MLVECAIVLEEFGPNIEQVCSVLLKRGRSPLMTIVTESKMPIRTVRESLFVLMQHGLVKYAESPEGQRLIAHYVAISENIIRRTRYPLYLYKAGLEFGPIGQQIVQTLLVNGQLTFANIKKHIAAPLANTEIYTTNDDGKSLEDVFGEMTASKFIIETMPIDFIYTVDRVLQEEAAAVADAGVPLTAAELGKLRKKLASERQNGLENDNVQDESSGKRKIIAFEDVIANNKKQKLEKDAQIEEDVIWVVNPDRFHTLLRREEFCDIATKIVNPVAGQIMNELLLFAGDGHVVDPAGGSSGIVSVMHLSRKLKDLSMDVENASGSSLKEYLEIMGMKEYGLVKRTDDSSGGGSYQVDFKDLTERLQVRLIENIIIEKYGSVACRIWRVLHSKGKLDDKQIAKLAMIPGKIARDCLYKLTQSSLIYLQDVPKTADHSAQRTFFLWGVSIKQCRETLIADMHKTIGNLRVRRKYEMQQQALLIEKMQRSDVENNPEELLNQTEWEAWNDLKRVLGVLKVMEIRIERSILLLNNWN